YMVAFTLLPTKPLQFTCFRRVPTLKIRYIARKVKRDWLSGERRERTVLPTALYKVSDSNNNDEKASQRSAIRNHRREHQEGTSESGHAAARGTVGGAVWCQPFTGPPGPGQPAPGRIDLHLRWPW